MTEKINAQISEFVDDELADEECTLLVKRVCSDDNLQSRLSRFALIGDVIRGDHVAADIGLSHRISRAIDGDQLDSVAPASESSWRRWAKPISGIAVAATVAGVSLFSLQQSNNSLPNALPSTATALVGGVDGSTALNPIDVPRFRTPEVRPASVLPQSRMDQYLLKHRGVATSMGGVTIMGVREIGSDKIDTTGVEGLPTSTILPSSEGQEENPQ